MAAVTKRSGLDARPAYLDLAQPDLMSVVGELAAAGHRRAIIVPLLFTAAFHATVDVPEAVGEAAAAAGLELGVTGILGTGEDVAEVIRGVIADAHLDPATDLLLFAVGSSDANANAAVAALGERLSAGRPGAVDVAFGTCEPRASALLADRQGPVAIVPLFLADGLLLDPIRRLATERGWAITDPLGDRAADLVVRRYSDLARSHGR
jgi:sirohydrochlorin cobaltochelatase